MLSTPKSSGYSPGNHLSAKLPWGGRGTPPELLHHHPNTLTFPSLIFGVFGHFPSLVTLWSWSLQGETQDQDPKIKSQFFKILGELSICSWTRKSSFAVFVSGKIMPLTV